MVATSDAGSQLNAPGRALAQSCGNLMWQNILQSLQQELNRLSATLSFAPAWAIWAALLVGAFAVACFVHAGVLEFLDRILRQRRPYLNRVLAATKNPTRLALLLIALAIVLPPAPLGTDTRLVFVRCWCSPRFAFFTPIALVVRVPFILVVNPCRSNRLPT